MYGKSSELNPEKKKNHSDVILKYGNYYGKILSRINMGKYILSNALFIYQFWKYLSKLHNSRFL